MNEGNGLANETIDVDLAPFVVTFAEHCAYAADNIGGSLSVVANVL
jgi:hypothetical protein